MPRSTRILQACQDCRRRKIGCDGLKPTCGRCAKHHRACQWPKRLAPGGYLAFSPEESDVQGTDFSAHASVHHDIVTGTTSGTVTTTQANDLPPARVVELLLDVFWKHHYVVELCGCIHREDFERNVQSEPYRFLLYSIMALSSLYISLEDLDARFASARDFSDLYASKAMLASRMSSDEPTVTTIQANLCLGLRELLAMTSTKAWMYVGLAIRMAQALRMRMEYNDRHHPRQREIRRRTFWACITLDRLVAYCTFRTQTIEIDLVTIHLPCTKAAFAFGRDEPGPLLETVGSQDESSDQVEVMPHFLKSLVLWGDIAAFYVNRGRRRSPTTPEDPEGPYYKLEHTITSWMERFPEHLRWSEQNLQAHRSMATAEPYINMHFLLKHAQFVVHQEYLPQSEEVEAMANKARTDHAGVPFTFCNLTTLCRCLQNAKEVVAMVELLSTIGLRPCQSPPRLSAGIAVVTAASVLLWAQYATHLVKTDDYSVIAEDVAQAKLRFDFLLRTVKAWAVNWELAQVWCNSLMLLEELYNTIYKQDTTTSLIDATQEDDTNEGGAGAPLTRLREGDGLPDASKIPHGVYYKVRLITGLSMENPQMCKRMLRLTAQKSKEMNWLSQTLGFSDSDFIWMDDIQFDPDFDPWVATPTTHEGPQVS